LQDCVESIALLIIDGTHLPYIALHLLLVKKQLEKSVFYVLYMLLQTGAFQKCLKTDNVCVHVHVCVYATVLYPVNAFGDIWIQCQRGNVFQKNNFTK